MQKFCQHTFQPDILLDANGFVPIYQIALGLVSKRLIFMSVVHVELFSNEIIC